MALDVLWNLTGLPKGGLSVASYAETLRRDVQAVPAVDIKGRQMNLLLFCFAALLILVALISWRFE